MKLIRAYVVGGCVATTRLLNNSGHIWAQHDADKPNADLSDYDMIVFTGGADVDPKYYGEASIEGLWLSERRDVSDFDIFMRTKDTHYHFGICRGMQFLAVANGMKLWQDISGHNLHTGHSMSPTIGKYKDKIIPGVTSVHHQALKVTNKTRENVIAYETYDQPVSATSPSLAVGTTQLTMVPEAAWFPETRSFGVQGHPEYSRASKEYVEYTLHHLLHDETTGYLLNKLGAR